MAPSPKWGLNREPSGEFMPTLDFAGASGSRSSSVRGGGETHRLSERRGAAIGTIEIPSPIGSAGGGSDGFPERRSPGSRSPAGTRFSPHHRTDGSDASGKSGVRRTATGGGSFHRPKKGKWRTRVRWGARMLFLFLVFYYFGRTLYQLTFFVKAGLNRYWYHPLERHRPIPCGVDTPPVDPFLAPLARRVKSSPKDVDDGAAAAEDDEDEDGRRERGKGRAEAGRGRSLQGSWSDDRDDDATNTGGRRHGPRRGSERSKDVVIERERASSGNERIQESDGNYGEGYSISDTAEDRFERKTGADADTLAMDVVGVGSVGGVDSSSMFGESTSTSANKKKTDGARFAILTLCDANAGYICAASAANKRRYCDLHGYDLIVSRTAADPTRPAAWSKILEVRKHLPRYDWLVFIDVDTLIMNPSVTLEQIADDTVDQVIAADHNGVNSGIWLVRNTPWSFYFLDELWAQDDLVKGNYLFHYEQRAFHRLFHTDPWSKQASVRGTAPYSGAAEVRQHSKIVNQCVFNSLLPWYVSGDFIVHFAGLKGVWECLIFFSYFDKSQETPGMRVSDKQWAEELGGENRGKASQMWQCMQFKTLFR